MLKYLVFPKLEFNTIHHNIVKTTINILAWFSTPIHIPYGICLKSSRYLNEVATYDIFEACMGNNMHIYAKIKKKNVFITKKIKIK